MKRATFRSWLVVGLLAVPLWMAMPRAAQADGGDTTGLRQQVDELKQLVQHLNERIEGLEKQLSTQPAADDRGAAAPAAPAAAAPQSAPPTANETVQRQWHRIDHGMTTQEVTALLGQPHRTMQVDTKTVWYYAYPAVGGGSIVFASDGEVDDWQSPPFNSWW